MQGTCTEIEKISFYGAQSQSYVKIHHDNMVCHWNRRVHTVAEGMLGQVEDFKVFRDKRPAW